MYVLLRTFCDYVTAMIPLLYNSGRFHVPDSKQHGQVGPLLGRIPTEALIKRDVLKGALEFRYFKH